MNPVTARLVHALGDRRVARFVAAWDALEALAVRVSKQDASRADAREWVALRRRLRRLYRRYEGALSAHWPDKHAGGEPLAADPFAALLAPENAGAFKADWGLMQQLPAARQALNEWLLRELEAQGRTLRPR